MRRGREKPTKIPGTLFPFLHSPRRSGPAPHCARVAPLAAIGGGRIKDCFLLTASPRAMTTPSDGAQLRRVMNDKGLRSYRGNPLSPYRYQYLLRNSFYCGLFTINSEMHQGAHESLVSKEIFDRVQEVMKRRTKSNSPRLKSYAYRGLFRCGECGAGIDGNAKGPQLSPLYQAHQKGLLSTVCPGRSDERAGRNRAPVGFAPGPYCRRYPPLPRS